MRAAVVAGVSLAAVASGAESAAVVVAGRGKARWAHLASDQW